MKKKLTLTPAQWELILGFEVLDPDGWDRRGAFFQADWLKPLTFNQFMDKADVSTCSYHPSRLSLLAIVLDRPLRSVIEI